MDDSEGHSYGQLVIGSFIMTTCPSSIMYHAEFFGKTSNHTGESVPLEPRFGALYLLAFPKTKITFEREEISDRDVIQENMIGQQMTIWRTV